VGEIEKNLPRSGSLSKKMLQEIQVIDPSFSETKSLRDARGWVESMRNGLQQRVTELQQLEE
jgi:hypothetical protein